MAYIVTDPCVKCKYTDCVAVCPVDCFFEGKDMLVIHPDECIDCGACEPECPTTAIFEESEVRDEHSAYIGINAFFSGAIHDPGRADTQGWPSALVSGMGNAPWPNIVEQKDPLPGADDSANKTGKITDLSPDPA